MFWTIVAAILFVSFLPLILYVLLAILYFGAMAFGVIIELIVQIINLIFGKKTEKK